MEYVKRELRRKEKFSRDQENMSSPHPLVNSSFRLQAELFYRKSTSTCRRMPVLNGHREFKAELGLVETVLSPGCDSYTKWITCAY